jgi:hypothetical protein
LLVIILSNGRHANACTFNPMAMIVLRITTFGYRQRGYLLFFS